MANSMCWDRSSAMGRIGSTLEGVRAGRLAHMGIVKIRGRGRRGLVHRLGMGDDGWGEKRCRDCRVGWD